MCQTILSKDFYVKIKNMKSKLLIFNIVIILIISLAPTNGNMLGNYFDKIVHFLMYLILGINISRTYKNKTQANQLLLISALMGFIIEIVQGYIPGRNTSIYDGLANLTGLLMARFFKK